MSDTILMKVHDKEYPITGDFTNRELHTIKQVAGVRAGELFDALNAGDSDVLVALAFVAVVRGGTQRPTLDELWDLELGAITAEFPEDEPDPTPAAQAAEIGNPETTREDSGPPSSDTSSISVPVTSGT